MVELIDFLNARLDDDEAYARNAFGDHNAAGPEWREQWSGALNIGDAEDLVLTNDSQVSRFMERFDPARVLAEVEAKRRLLTEHAVVDPGEEWQHCRVCHDYGSHDASQAPCATLKLLALPYLGHPDYREEWKP